MKPARKPNRKPNWCKAHHTNDRRFSLNCPSCRRKMHVHERDIRDVRAGNLVMPSCGACHRHSFLLLAAGNKRISLALNDGNMPAYQLTIGIKVR